MRIRCRTARPVVAIALVSAFVLLGLGAILSPAEAARPVVLTASISPSTQSLFFGCYRCDTWAFVTLAGKYGYPPYYYYVNWGDGSAVSSAGPVTGPVNMTHHYPWVAHRYTVTLTVIDLTGTTATASATVLIKNFRK